MNRITTRKRPLSHKAAAFGAPLALAAGYFAWLNLPPSESGTPAEPPQPASKGYDELRAAAAGEIRTDDVNNAVGLRPRDPVRVTSPDEQATLAAENMLTLYAVRRAIPLPYSNPRVRSLSDPTPDLTAFRSLSRLLVLDAHVKSAAGDHPGAANAALDSIELGCQIPRDGGLDAQMAGLSCESAGATALWSEVDKLDAGESAAIAARLENVLSQRRPFAEALREDYATSHAILLAELSKKSTVASYNDIMRTRQTPYRGFFPETTSLFDTISLDLTLLTRGKRQICSELERAYGRGITQSEMPYNPGSLESPAPADPIVGLLVPYYSRAAFRNTAVRMQEGLLLCALSLRAYRLHHGDYPRSLKDLINEGLLAHVPDDPFAPKFGIPFAYWRVNATKYTLYSIGPDGIDSGGQPLVAQNLDPSPMFPQPGDTGDWVVGANVARAVSESP